MKEFIVLKKIGTFNADVVRDFDNYADAYALSILLKKSEENERIRYFVASNVTETTGVEQLLFPCFNLQTLSSHK